jgi:hypothetical protein
MTLQLLHSEFPYIRGKFDFLFYQCGSGDEERKGRGIRIEDGKDEYGKL